MSLKTAENNNKENDFTCCTCCTGTKKCDSTSCDVDGLNGVRSPCATKRCAVDGPILTDAVEVVKPIPQSHSRLSSKFAEPVSCTTEAKKYYDARYELVLTLALLAKKHPRLGVFSASFMKVKFMDLLKPQAYTLLRSFGSKMPIPYSNLHTPDTRLPIQAFAVSDNSMFFNSIFNSIEEQGLDAKQECVRALEPRVVAWTKDCAREKIFCKRVPHIMSLLIHDNKLLSSTEGGVIFCTDLNDDDNNEVEPVTQEFIGHRGVVHCMLVYGDKLITGSDDHDDYVRVWDLKSCECLHSFGGVLHRGSVTSLAIHGHILYTGSIDGSVKAWDLENSYSSVESLCIESTAKDFPPVGSLAVIGDLLCIGNYASRIMVYGLRGDSPKYITDLVGHCGEVHAMASHDGILYSGAHDWTCLNMDSNEVFSVLVWDLNTMNADIKGCCCHRPKTSLRCHNWNINCIKVHDGKLYTASSDGTVNVWII